MQIQWYPGHMAKSIRMMEENLAVTDIVIYVLDARAPYSCFNPMFNRLFRGKPIIYAINKADLGDRRRVNDWTNKLSTGGNASVAITSTTSKTALPIINIAQKMCLEKLERYARKGVKTSIRAMVVGVPNSGKSTLINNLCGSAKTLTGNKPGVTRGKQWVRINDYFELLDTPGTLYPRFENQIVAKHLAYLGSIKDEVIDTYELSLSLLDELNEIDNTILSTRYKVAYEESADITMEKLAKARGYILKGNLADKERMSIAFLDDFRKGKLGNITFEKVGDYNLDE